MAEMDSLSTYEQLGGRYVAWRGDEVYASAESYDDLADYLHERGWPEDLIVEYVEHPDVIRV